MSLYSDQGSFDGSRELKDPIHVMMRLVDPSVTDLPSNILAVYLSAALKIYGYWASVLTEKWNDQFLPTVKETVAQLRAGFQPFASSEDVEVQERVR
jgi:AP-3 complex subunit delta